MGLAILDHRLLHHVSQVVLLHLRLGNARERCELVDHRLDVADLSHDGVGQLLERFAILPDD